MRKMTIRTNEGLQVVVRDATEPATIQITSQDIAKSKKQDPTGCVAAQAALRCFKDVKEVKVQMKCTYLRLGMGRRAHWLRYMTPQRLRNEIIAFDRGGDFEPGEYVIKPNPPSEKLGADRKIKPSAKKIPARGNRYKSYPVANVRARLSRGG